MEKPPIRGDSVRHSWSVVHENDDPISPYAVTAQMDAQRIEDVLRNRGFSQDQVDSWWATSNPALGGKSPTQFWLSEEYPSEAIIETVRDAAFGDTPTETS